MSKHNVFRNGRVYVCQEMCDTCVFRPGNLMHLKPGRLRGMVAAARKADTAIVCHATLDGDNAVCRGFFERYPTQPLQIAERLNFIIYVQPPRKESR